VLTVNLLLLLLLRLLRLLLLPQPSPSEAVQYRPHWRGGGESRTEEDQQSKNEGKGRQM
jgi:hypothetical protein